MQLKYLFSIFLLFGIASYSNYAQATDVDSDNDGFLDSVDVDDDGNGLIEISTLAELNNIRNNLAGDAYNDGNGDVSTGCGNGATLFVCSGYELVNDLDFDTNDDNAIDASDDFYNSGEGWEPIGSDSSAFSGTFNGNGYSIIDLFINRPSTNNVGLFAALSGAEIRELKISGELLSVTGNANVGIIAGNHASEDEIAFVSLNVGGSLAGVRKVGALQGLTGDMSVTDTHVSTLITATGDYIGGFIGEADANNVSLITGSSFTGTVSGNSYVGGMVGESDKVKVTYSYVTGSTVGAEDYIGGFLGGSYEGIIENSFVIGTVTSLATYAGGLIGYGSEATISNSFSSGNITANDDAAGLIAYGEYSLSITNSYATGTISATDLSGADAGGLSSDAPSGGDDFIAIDSYWDTEVTGQSTSAESQGTGYTTSALQTPTTNSGIFASWSATDWDFGTDAQYPAIVNNGNVYRDADNDGYWTFEDAFDDDPTEHLDSDNDNVGDNADVFPNDPTEWADNDNDGLGNNADTDDDNDLVLDGDDNCPYVSNADQASSDSDGFGDACDVDDDGDGLIEISTLAELNNIRNNLAGTAYNDGTGDNTTGCGEGSAVLVCNGYELVNDLDFDTNGDDAIDASDDYYNAGDGWEPIGSDSDAFSAIFNGNGLSIIDLYINRTSTSNVGFFAALDGAEIRNLTFAGDLLSVAGKSKVGVVAGDKASNDEVTYANLNVSGSVSGTSYVGALQGYVADVNVSDTNVSTTVIGSGSGVGGFFGEVDGTTPDASLITTSSFTGSVSGYRYVGGFVGDAYDLNVTYSYVSGSVHGSDSYIGGILGGSEFDTIEHSFTTGSVQAEDTYAGGLVGYSATISISDSFSSATITAKDYAAGIIAYSEYGLSITNSYASGAISVTTDSGPDVGGIAVDVDPIPYTESNVYWDTESTGQATSENNQGTGYTTSALQTPTTNSGIFASWSTADWNFGTDSEYPAIIINGNVYRDADEDGYWAFEDAFDNDPTEHLDSDSDNVGDNSDAFPNDSEEWADNDNDGIGDNADTDDDNDGISDLIEGQYGLDSLDNSDAWADLDSDGSLNLDELLLGTDMNDVSDFVSALEPTFNNGNVAYYNLTDGSNDEFELGTMLQEGDQFFFTGYYYDVPYNDDYGVIAKMNADGSFDESWGDQGIYYGNGDDLGSYIYGITKMNHGGYLAGVTYHTSDAVLASISADGQFDSSSLFSTESTPGIFQTKGSRSVTPVAYQSATNEIYIGSTVTGSNSKGYIEKVGIDGVLDSSFAGGQGYYEFNFSSGSSTEAVQNIFEQDSGNIVYAITLIHELKFIEMTPEGELNITLGDAGLVTPELNGYYHNDVIQLSDGRFAILYDGQIDGDDGVHVVIYDQTFNIDTSFGASGYFSFTEENVNYEAVALFEQANGTLLIATTISVNGIDGTQLIQVTSDGQLDTRFNQIGYSRSLHTEDADFFKAVRLDSGHVVFGGDDQDSDYQAVLTMMSNAYDHDFDGIPDVDDAFPEDPSETADSDNDGVGDNADAFPNDPNESVDSDNDGYGDQSDAFPYDETEWLDSDSDGTGDNADAFPNDPNESVDSDNDGYGDQSDAFPYDETEWLDSDSDGTGDNADAFPNDPNESADSDNDGYGDQSDAFPYDETEWLDSDSDGTGDNADAYPNDPTQSADTTAPVISDIQNFVIEATGEFTFVDISAPVATDDLDKNPTVSVDNDNFNFSLGEHTLVWTATDANGNSSAAEQLVVVEDTTAPSFEQVEDMTINAQGVRTDISNLVEAYALDLVDGEMMGEIVGETQLVSGRHTVQISAADNAGNEGTISIILDIVPELTVASSYAVEAGNSYEMSAYLSGEAPTYPVQISYSLMINGLVNNQLVSTIEAGQLGTLVFEVPADVSTLDTLTIIIDSSSNAFIGNENQTQLQIIETNFAPLMTLSVRQNGSLVSVIDPDDGLVTLSADVIDINQADEHDITFVPSSSGLVDETNDNNASTFEIDPSLMPAGVYALEVTAAENNTQELLSVTRQVQLVVAELPTLLAGEDVDADGIADIDEGYSDSDGDGIADYLDDDNNTTRLPIAEGTEPMQTEAGLELTLGTIVARLGIEARDSGLTGDEFDDLVNDGDANSVDDSYEAITPLYNFTINGLTQQGDSVAIVIPLADGSVIPANAVYRKYTAALGWYNYVEDANNQIASATTDVNGNCPAPNSPVYAEPESTGIVEGNNCIQLVIEDGGPNDSDGEVNGSIEDPGVIAVEIDEESPVNNAPTVSIDSHNASVEEGESITLVAQGSDLDGDDLTYLWEQVSGPDVSFDDVTNQQVVITLPEVSEDSTIEVRVTVSDGEESQTSTTTITVNNADETVVVTPDPEPDSGSSSGGGSMVWLLVLLSLIRASQLCRQR